MDASAWLAEFTRSLPEQSNASNAGRSMLHLPKIQIFGGGSKGLMTAHPSDESSSPSASGNNEGVSPHSIGSPILRPKTLPCLLGFLRFL